MNVKPEEDIKHLVVKLAEMLIRDIPGPPDCGDESELDYLSIMTRVVRECVKFNENANHQWRQTIENQYEKKLKEMELNCTAANSVNEQLKHENAEFCAKIKQLESTERSLRADLKGSTITVNELQCDVRMLKSKLDAQARLIEVENCACCGYNFNKQEPPGWSDLDGYRIIMPGADIMIVTNAPTEQVHKLMVQPYDDEESTVGERIRKAGFICCESSTKTSEPLDAS